MSASMTFRTSTPFDRAVAQALTWLYRSAAALVDALQPRRTAEPRTVEELLALAASYEATQPSFAADLRAAAGR